MSWQSLLRSDMGGEPRKSIETELASLLALRSLLEYAWVAAIDGWWLLCVARVITASHEQVCTRHVCLSVTLISALLQYAAAIIKRVCGVEAMAVGLPS